MNSNGFIVAGVTSSFLAVAALAGEGGCPALRSAQWIGVSGDPVAAACADMNSDGFPDIVAAVKLTATTGVLEVMYSNQLGKAEFAYTVALPWGVRSDPWASCLLALGDMDNDGDSDACYVDKDLRIRLLRHEADHSWTHTAATLPAMSDGRILLRDMNGDGNLDVVCNYVPADKINIVLGTGMATFGAIESIPIAGDPLAFDVGDLDGDGDPEIAVVPQNPTFPGNPNPDVVIYKRESNGTFTLSEQLAEGNSQDLRLRDMDGDGDLDILAVGPNINVWLNDGTGTLGAQISSYDNVGGNLTVADVNGDGLPEAIEIGSQYGGPKVVVAMNLGGGSFAMNSPDYFLSGAAFRSLAAADFDLDGREDLIAASDVTNNLVLLATRPTGTVPLPAQFPTAGQPTEVAVADLNGDGVQDIAVSNYPNKVSIIKGAGNGAYLPTTSFTSGYGAMAIVAGDMDGDGDIDLVTAEQDAARVAVWVNSGSAVFALGAAIPTGLGTVAVELGDLDSDGDLDIAAVCRNAEKMAISLNNGNGTFTAPVLHWLNSDPMDLVLGDLDGDGDKDCAICGISPGTVTIYKNNGNGTFLLFNTTYSVPEPASIALGDINSNGPLDVVVVDGAYALLGVHLNDGNGVLADHTTQPTTLGPACCGTTDVDNDGDTDVIVGCYSSDAFLIFRNTGTSLTTPPTSLTVMESYAAYGGCDGFAMADLNGDSFVDFVVGAFVNSRVSLCYNAGVHPNGCGTAQCLGDWNGDGAVDGADLGVLLATWGPCGSCPADLDANGQVDGADLGVLLGQWGNCER